MTGKQVTKPKKKPDKKKAHQKRAAPGKRKKSIVIPPDSIPGKMLADVKQFIRGKTDSLQRTDRKKMFLLNFPYLLFSYVFNKICWLYRVSMGETAWDANSGSSDHAFRYELIRFSGCN